MAWVACDKDFEQEYVHGSEPDRHPLMGYWYCGEESIALPKGSIKKLIGRDLTWEDEPVELT